MHLRSDFCLADAGKEDQTASLVAATAVPFQMLSRIPVENRRKNSLLALTSSSSLAEETCIGRELSSGKKVAS
jgi:hypothetical protein